jgi:uncharacterized protein YgfB (UPF0149 family)
VSLDALDDLNKWVTEAIFHAEHAVPGSAESTAFYRRVSDLEEQISVLVPPDQLQGALARVGAVTAALDADDWLRATKLASSYMVGAPHDLTEELQELLVEAEQASQHLPEPLVLPISYVLPDAA